MITKLKFHKLGNFDFLKSSQNKIWWTLIVNLYFFPKHWRFSIISSIYRICLYIFIPSVPSWSSFILETVFLETVFSGGRKTGVPERKPSFSTLPHPCFSKKQHNLLFFSSFSPCTFSICSFLMRRKSIFDRCL